MATNFGVEERVSSKNNPRIRWSDSYAKAQEAIEALSTILPKIPSSLASTEKPANSLLNDPEIAAQISNLLRQPDSGAGDNILCRWLYDTFQSNEPDLHLVVLRYLPIIAGVYLSRVALHKPLAGFEAVFLALYANETTSRKGNSVTVSIPDLSHASIYHESKQTMPRNSATELNIAVISPSLQPYGTVRSAKRARIVGVAMELYFSKISQMPINSKIEFCEFCKIWGGQKDCENGDEIENNNNKNGEEKGRINLPWELLQPILRILGHCLMGPNKDDDLFEAACDACRCVHARALHDINPKAILATGSLLKLAKRTCQQNDEVDHTEILHTNIITL